MLNALADLATRHPRRVVVTALIAAAIAGGIGHGVANRLDPYGADDPATQSVQADNRLHDAGYRDLSVIALVRGVNMSSPATKRRVEALAARISQDPSVARVGSFYTSGSPALVSNDGRSTY